MAEGQVTVEGRTYPMATPFMILATQNPAEQEGTFPLPAAQLDRFAVRVRLGYPSQVNELALLDRHLQSHSRPTAAALSKTEWQELQAAARRVHLSPDLRWYITELANHLRGHPLIGLGPSPRASQMLARAAQAMAAAEGRGYVLPDDVKAMAETVLAHRLTLSPAGLLYGLRVETILNDMLDGLPTLRHDREPAG
jgi:MoxR-like ATPase